ncbi:hypothetical protein [Krasilnikovia sp. MM14-A1259]|uniref:hypothetical protein n=1 Tax=Krasilnikovia sp. MM14-A1259 TaxID=3373539 RepID=UPI0037FAB303
MEGHRAHGRVRYRCRHGHTSASDADPSRLKTLYVRQDQLIAQANGQLASLLVLRPDMINAMDIAEQLADAGSRSSALLSASPSTPGSTIQTPSRRRQPRPRTRPASRRSLD